MTESQNIEYKTAWRDEYLKWVCGFSNANGGKLLIGVNDKGQIIGIEDNKRLMEDIPNKIVNYLGIIADVNLLDSEGKQYIEIIVSPASVPISYKGTYHYRSGSTKQEMKGAELQHFILKKMGKTFDELPADGANINHLDEKVVRKFVKKALQANRISPDAAQDDIVTVLSNLKLITEDGKIKNAAVLLFGKDPLRFFSSVTFKIGRFGDSNHDLRFQDVIEGNIFEMPDKIIETLRAKYLVSPIRYEGLQRIEELEYPEEALREAVLNAIIHKDYTSVHIQLSVYDDKIILWNPGKLPEEIAIEDLKRKHPSIPRNKYIADVFFKAGYIETWGRGIQKIISGFIKAGHPEPTFEELAGGLQVTLNKSVEKNVEKSVEKSVEKIVRLIDNNPTITQLELAEATGLSRRGIEKNISKLKEIGLLKRIGPAKGGHWKITKL